MVGSIRSSSTDSALTQRNRSRRFPVDLEASIEIEGVESPARIQDISESGVALVGDAPKLSNEQFLDLHIEGYSRLQGRVVREFAGGYAMQFDSNSRLKISEQELTEFRQRAERGA